MTNPFDAAALQLLSGQSAASEPSEPVDGDRLLRDISVFIARFLYCSEHQRTVLALWVLHTYCYHAAQITPYLSIQSQQKQSGKTLCLQLLQLLCDFPTLTAGFTASSLLRNMQGAATDTLLLDECQASVGTRARPKAPTLRAILIRGTHPDPDHLTITRDRRTFCPKAFAGRAPLPEDLADHSLPIILQPLDSCVAQPPGSPARASLGFARDGVEVGSPARASLGFARDGVEVPSAASGLHSNLPPAAEPTIEHFHLRWATAAVMPLRKQLHDWCSQNIARLQEMPPCPEDLFPPNLSCRQQDLAEPLLHLASLIGGEWPQAIRDALSAVFEEQCHFHLQPSIQLLADIRDCFAYHAYPERLNTALVLEWVHSLPSRPWDADGPLSAQKLVRLLAPFEIHPRNQRIGKRKPKRGYQLKDFTEPWLKHFGFTVPQSEIANNKTACNAVSLAGEFPAPNQESVAQPPVSPELEQDQDNVSPNPELATGSRKLQAQPEFVNNTCPRGELASRRDEPCNTVSPQVEPAQPKQPAVPVPEPNIGGFNRLTHLHQRLRLQGLCPPLDVLANMYSFDWLKAALDWVDMHPEWSNQFRYKPAMEFIAAFQNGPVREFADRFKNQ